MKRIALALLSVAFLAGCGGNKAGSAANAKIKATGPVLARVGDEVLTKDQLLMLFRGQVPPDAPRDRLQSVLESWVNGEVWYQEALRRGIGQDETTLLALRNEERNAIATMYLSRVRDTVTLTDAEMYQYFQQHKNDYIVGTRIAYIILRDPAMAEKVLADVKGGADFQQTARQVSYEAEESRGIATNFFVRNDSNMFLLQLSPDLNQAIFALQPGQISDIVEVSGAGGSTYWIVKCFERRQLKSDVKFEDVKKDISAELLPWKQKQVAEDFSDQLRKKTKIEINVDNFYGGKK